MTGDAFDRNVAVPERTPPLRLRYRLGGYLEFEPPCTRTAGLESVWVHRTPKSLRLPPGSSHRVLPDPAFNVAFIAQRDDRGRICDGRLVLIGPKTHPHVFTFVPGGEIAAVRVKLEWARALLGVDPTAHDDGVDGLADAVPAVATRILGALEHSTSALHAAALLADGLQLRRRLPTRHEVSAAAMDLVRRSHGRIPVERLAEHLGLSARHLYRIVQRDAGLALKPFARVHRYLFALTNADTAPSPEWARLSVEAGFSDQSHLVRESRALTGMPPAAVHRERWGEDRLFNAG